MCQSTFCCDFADVYALLVRHEAQYRKDDETGEYRSAAVDARDEDTVPEESVTS